MITGMKHSGRSMIDFSNSGLSTSYNFFHMTFCYSLGYFETICFSTLKTRVMRNDGLVVGLLLQNVRNLFL